MVSRTLFVICFHGGCHQLGYFRFMWPVIFKVAFCRSAIVCTHSRSFLVVAGVLQLNLGRDLGPLLSSCLTYPPERMFPCSKKKKNERDDMHMLLVREGRVVQFTCVNNSVRNISVFNLSSGSLLKPPPFSNRLLFCFENKHCNFPKRN